MLKIMTLNEIPPSALQRKQLLEEILKSTEKAPHWPPLLNEFRTLVNSNSTETPEALLDQIERAGLLEECSDIVRHSLEGPGLKKMINFLNPLLMNYRHKRGIHPESESSYRYRLTYSKKNPLVILGTAELQRIFLCALQSEGVLFKYDFSKYPKPMLELAPILAANTSGLNEFVEFHCRQELPFHTKEFPNRLNLRLPKGLFVQSCERIQTFASSISELATLAHWSWPIDSSVISQELLRQRISRFTKSPKWPLKNIHGEDSTCDLKSVIRDLQIRGHLLVWSTDLTYEHSPNPLRAMAQILSIESNQINDLERTSLSLNEDHRVHQQDRFSRKLKNIHEDATILDGDSSITIHNDDDDFIAL